MFLKHLGRLQFELGYGSYFNLNEYAIINELTTLLLWCLWDKN